MASLQLHSINARCRTLTEHKWRIHAPNFEGEKVCPDYRVWPWNGHRLFAYDLMAFLRPRLFVELGTYWGNSFFSFVQAVKDYDLKTQCIAVDTWIGDGHTGEYAEDVYDVVNNISRTYFPKNNIRLLRSTFIEALASVSDGSVDLLHIDGYHTYEAVSEDFSSWFPKLAENGIVLFHDVSDTCDYGSVRYWKELCSQYPGFTFQHSWGLGVLFPKGDFWLKQMEENNIQDKLSIYKWQSEYNLLKIQMEACENRCERQDALIKYQEAQLQELQARIAQFESQAEKSNALYPAWIAKIFRPLK
jgi:Methyltransferase domain